MQECFEKWIIIGILINSLLAVLAISCLFLLAVLPFIFTFLSEQFILNYDFIIPFTDPNELSGFIINYTFQTGLIMVGCIGFAGAANIVVNFTLHLSSFFECSEIYLNQLDDIPNDYRNKCFQEEKVFKRLINIYNLNNKFLESFEMSFQFYHFFDLGLSMMAIVVCIYGLTLVRKVLRKKNQYFDLTTCSHVPFFSVMLFHLVYWHWYLIFFPCFCGEILDRRMASFNDFIDKIPWYKLSVREQKTLQIIMIFSQRSKSISYFLGPFNLASFIEVWFFLIERFEFIQLNFQICKNIYSYVLALKTLDT